ncbi:MAG: metallopeptidase TldD-related protein [Thermoplasmata archaeon]
MDIEKMYNKVSRKVDQAAVKITRIKIDQVRFSNNEIDINNSWDVEDASIFLAKNGRTFMFNLKNENDLDNLLDLSVKALSNIEKNDDFISLNDKKQKYRNRKKNNEKIINFDGSEYVNKFLDEIRPFVKRAGGVLYKKEISNDIMTPFNNGEDTINGIEFVARAFNDYDNPAQVSFMTSSDNDLIKLDDAKDELLELSKKVGKTVEGKDGKYKVIFHPLCFASIASYTIPMASAFQVDSGMSLFAGRMGQKIGSSLLTLYDDPADDTMIGARIMDDEGTSTKKTAVIEKGIVKNYLHNNSTAKKYNTESTGNAGIINPSPWQINVEAGNEDISDMISSTKKGLFIVNTWYTRFQDYREGIFSTIPRDGIFYIENGEIRESWGGIRISDSLLNIFKNIEGISKETKKVKWWDETLPTRSPYVEVEDVNISRSK